MVAQVGYSVAGRSRGRVAPYAVCTVHMGTRCASFLVEPQNQGRQFVSGLVSKPLTNCRPWFCTRTVFTRLASKPMVTVSVGLASKPAMMVWLQNLLRRFSLVWPQNQWRRFSPIWPQNWWQRFLLVWPQNLWWVSWLSLKTKVVKGLPVSASKPAASVW
jgi:hypothetical protein